MFIVSHFHPAASLPASARASARETTGMFLKKRAASFSGRSSVFFQEHAEGVTDGQASGFRRMPVRVDAHSCVGRRGQLCRRSYTVV